MDVSSNRTGRIGIFMEMEQGILLNTFHSTIYVKKCDFFQRFYDPSASGSPLHLDESCFFQLRQDPSDNDRIFIVTDSMVITGYLIFFYIYIITTNHMYCY